MNKTQTALECPSSSYPDEALDAVHAAHDLHAALRKIGVSGRTTDLGAACVVKGQGAANLSQLVRRKQISGISSRLVPLPNLHDAAEDLINALRDAGISGPTVDDCNGCVISGRDAVAVTQLIDDALCPAYQIIDDLTACFLSHGLTIPSLVIVDGMVDLGSLSIPAAARIATALGASAPPPVDDAVDDLAIWEYGIGIGRLLCDALRRTTGGAVIDLAFHPDCSRCDQASVITVGRIELDAAQRLIVALRASAGAGATDGQST